MGQPVAADDIHGTPDEVHAGRATGASSVPLRAVLEVKSLDGERELPVLRLRPAA